MEIQRKGRKFIIQGDGTGWVFNRTFPTKWKALIALEVFKKGGGVSDYFKAAREQPRRIMDAYKVRARLEEALREIKELNPTSEEIEEFAKDAPYGMVTFTKDEYYFGPRLHDTWGIKQGGQVHIDIGSSGYHLMLDRASAWGFIEFIKNKRRGV